MKCEICNIKNNNSLINLGYQPIPDNLSKNLQTSLNKRKFKTYKKRRRYSRGYYSKGIS